MAMLAARAGFRGLSGDVREIPEYCYSTSLDPRSWFAGWMDACQPYTQAELQAMTASQMAQACAGSSDPAACAATGVTAASSSAAAAGASDPEGLCEYNATQEHPWLVKLFGTASACKLATGEYNTALVVGGAVGLGLLILFLKRR
jgi:hypothetical protein